MEEYVMTIIKRASVFMILAQAFVHFRPSASYEKYFKFLIGIMTMVILTVPFIELFQKGTVQEYQQRMVHYMEEMQKSSIRELPESVTPSDTYLQTMQDEIKSKLNKELVKDGYQLKEVELLDLQEEIGIRVMLSHATVGEQEIKIEKINPVQLRTSAEEEKLKKRIAEILELEEGRVEVDIVE